MLNRYYIEKINTDYTCKSSFRNKCKHYPPLIKEWFSSIYAFNNNTVKVLPASDKNLSLLVNNYFNLYNTKLDRKTKTKQLRIKKIKSSTNKLLISKLNLKHTSDKINITVYTYNRRKRYYLNKTANTASFASPTSNKSEVFVFFMKNLKNNISDLELKIKRRTYNFLQKVVPYIKEKKHVSLTEHYNKYYMVDYVKKHMRKEIVSIRYKQSIYLEESKSQNQYMLALVGFIERIYNKKIGFNIINLKYFYNSASIFSKALMIKLNNRKNNATTTLTTSLSTFELPSLDKLTMYNEMYNKEKLVQNLSVKDLISSIGYDTTNNVTRNLSRGEDVLEQTLVAHNNDSIIRSSTCETNLNEVIKSLKNKYTNGVRIEIAGRLSKRNTANRSIFKVKHKGNIKNLDSSHKRLSTVVLRGYTKPNLMYDKCKSKLRIGAFGLKTWISSI